MHGESPKTQTVFRFNKEKVEKRSFNNYIEHLLYKYVGKIPNEETMKAIEEFNVKENLEEIENVDQFIDSL